ncbi:hypothetical protein MNBD_NITROSPINAE04-337 [hydrothermal vent metagenome]|uniref:Inner membrane protein YjeT (Clustered with HflC) n=1 Tax=hydrothermal vent metagenome TaxID=652676 RepID=A0A3B1BLF3_9ZZZZ
MKTFLTIIGIVMILEGIPYFTMPEQVKGVAGKIVTAENRYLRIIGFALMLGGLVAVAISRPW